MNFHSFFSFSLSLSIQQISKSVTFHWIFFSLCTYVTTIHFCLAVNAVCCIYICILYRPQNESFNWTLAIPFTDSQNTRSPIFSLRINSWKYFFHSIIGKSFFLAASQWKMEKIILFSSLSLDCFHYIVNFVYLTFSTLRHSVSETFIQFFQ